MAKQRLQELDALRGLAAFAVVLYHYFYRYDEIYGHQDLAVNWAHIGKFGVELFFMISGFVIFWTINRVERPLDFIVSRFSRLYPAYWGAVLMTFVLVSIWGLPGRDVTATDAALNLLMFHEYFYIPHVDGVYWSLTVELTFYFWIFVLYLYKGLDKLELAFSSVIILSVLHHLDLLSLPPLLGDLLMLKYLPFFLAGICFFKVVNGEGFSRKILLTLALSLLSTYFIYSLLHFGLFCGFYLLFYLAISGRLKFLTFKPLLFLGSISYSLYLVHQNLGYVVINQALVFGWDPIIGICLAIIVSVGMAAMFTRFIEKPSLSMIRRRYDNSEKVQRLANRLWNIS